MDRNAEPIQGPAEPIHGEGHCRRLGPSAATAAQEGRERNREPRGRGTKEGESCSRGEGKGGGESVEGEMRMVGVGVSGLRFGSVIYYSWKLGSCGLSLGSIWTVY